MKKIKILFSLLLIVINFSCSKDTEVDNNDSAENYHKDKDVEIIFENNSENGINIIFMGDGYLKGELRKNSGKYRHDAIKSIEFLFDSHPFFEYKAHFNAYIIYAESSLGNYQFGTNSTNGIINLNYDAVNDYVFKVKGRPRTNKDLVLLAINGQNDGVGVAVLGSNLAIFGTANSTISTTSAFSVMLHEVGHAFASLGDEYIIPNQNTTYVPEGLANLDNTNDLSLVKWNHFIGLQGYSSVGAFEGGGYLEFGMWRPEANSIMMGNVGSYFNAPSREAIVKRIMNLEGIEYDFNFFLINDIGNQLNKHSKNAKNDKNKRINCGGVRIY